MDRNVVTLSGRLESATSRTIGAAGRSLVEVRLRVSKPARRGEVDAHEVVPVVVWDTTVGAALLELEAGTGLVILGRISAREWQSPSGQAKTFLEVVAESVTVDAAMVATGEPIEATASVRVEPPPPRATAPPVTRPGGGGRGRSESEVPF